MSTYEEHSEKYFVDSLEIEERIEKIIENSEEEIIKLATRTLEEVEAEYILEDDFYLASNILEYYDKYKKLSDKQNIVFVKL